jgi:hypothetical protein
VQLVAALGQGEDPLGLCASSPTSRIRSPSAARGTGGPVAVAAVVLDLVVQRADGALQPQRLLHPVAGAVGVQAAPRLAQHLVPLPRVPGPLAGHPPGPGGAAALRQAVPEHPAEVVGGQLRALDPAVGGAPVGDLHQLQRLAGDPAGSVLRGEPLPVADAGHGQHGVRVLVQRSEQAGQVVGVPQVVGRQVGDHRRAGQVQARG